MRTRRIFAVFLRKPRDYEQGNHLDIDTLSIFSFLEHKDPERLQTLGNLASGLKDQSRYEEAETIRREELEL